MGYDRSAALDYYKVELEEFPKMSFRAYAPGFGALVASALVARVEARGLPVEVWLGEMSGLVDEFAASLKDWTLVRDGHPVPPTREEVRRLDVPFLKALLQAWGQTTHVRPATSRPEPESAEPEWSEADLGIPMQPLTPEPAEEPAEEPPPPPAPARKPTPTPKPRATARKTRAKPAPATA